MQSLFLFVADNILFKTTGWSSCIACCACRNIIICNSVQLHSEIFAPVAMATNCTRINTAVLPARKKKEKKERKKERKKEDNI